MPGQEFKVKVVGTRARETPSYRVKELKQAVMNAVGRLYAEDHSLIRRGVNEMALTFRLAFYLQERFPGYDVDCEYNRNLDGIKTTPEHTDTHGARPDILVHRREINAPTNLILLEAKRTGTHLDPADLRKVEHFVNGTGDDDPYQYQLGVVLLLKPETFTIEFIERRPPAPIARIRAGRSAKKSAL